jgi:hypothetical protein
MSLTQSKPNTNANDLQARLELTKSGFKSFVSKIRLPMNNDTKWTLEIVCLSDQITPINENSPVTDQAKNYLQNQLLNMQNEINTKKQEWLRLMKDK